jgi:hypothetical protein
MDNKEIQSCNEIMLMRTSISGDSTTSSDFLKLTSNQQTLLTAWCKYCQENSELHYNCWSFFRMLNNITSLPSLIFSSLAGISVISMVSDSECNKSKVILIYVLGSFGMFSGVLFAINKFYKYPELVELHDMFSHSYEVMQNDITSNLSLHQGFVFKNTAEFIKFMRSKLTAMIERAPPIPRYIRNKYLKKKTNMDFILVDIPKMENVDTTSSRNSIIVRGKASLSGLPLYTGKKLNRGDIRSSMSGNL